MNKRYFALKSLEQKRGQPFHPVLESCSNGLLRDITNILKFRNEGQQRGSRQYSVNMHVNIIGEAIVPGPQRIVQFMVSEGGVVTLADRDCGYELSEISADEAQRISKQVGDLQPSTDLIGSMMGGGYGDPRRPHAIGPR